MNERIDTAMSERVRRLFGKAPCRLQVAALPFRVDGDGLEVLLITSRDTGRWVLPKGWPEAGEEFCEAAAREAGEEAGLAGAVSRRETGRYFYAKGLSSGKEVPCEVLVYALRVERVAEKWKERHQRRRSWMPWSDAAARVHEPDLAALIRRFGSDPHAYA